VPLKNHKTVEEACDIANILNPQRLILWHREDYDGASEDYLKVATKICDKEILVPEDLDIVNYNWNYSDYLLSATQKTRVLKFNDYFDTC